MKRLLTVAVCAVLTFAATTAASAAPIPEIEPNGSLGGAQVIPSSAFTLPVPVDVFDLGFPTATISGLGGGRDVDFYAFMANGGDVYFDIDDDPFTFDTFLALFNSDGTLLAYGDDTLLDTIDPNDPSKGDPGSPVFQDTFLGVLTLPGPGTYYIAVSEFGNFPNALSAGGPYAFRELFGPGGVHGGFAVLSGAPPGDSTYTAGSSGNGTSSYTLNISVQNPAITAVPEPATMVLLGTGLMVAASRRRRR